MGDLVGIVGGAGAEGSYFANIFQKSGLEVAIADINTKKAAELGRENGYFVMPSEELARKSDLVVFSLPIDVTPTEIQRLAPMTHCAIADLTSIKTKAVDAMTAHAPPKVEVFSIHAMYRPTVSPWGQNILLMPVRPREGGEWFGRVQKILEKRKAQVSTLGAAQQHDDISAAVQLLPHAVAYAFLSVLEDFSGPRVTLVELQRYSTLFSRLMMESTGRLVSEPHTGKMYGLIQSENPNAGAIYGALINQLQRMREDAVNGKVDAFADMHKRLHGFLGMYAQAAAELTDQRMGHPLGLQLVYESGLHDKINSALGGFERKPEKYKEYLESTRIPEGALNKLQRDFVLAKKTFYREKESESEGTFAFYVRNKRTRDDKQLRFSPVNAENLEQIRQRELDVVRVQMLNRFNDPYLNLFSTWRSKPELHYLGPLVAFG